MSDLLNAVASLVDLNVVTINWAALQQIDIILRLILQVVLFIASATFSMSETALFSLRDSDLDSLEKEKPEKAQRLRSLLDEPRRLIVSILCGNEIINIAATINLAGILLVLFGNPETAGVANTLIMLPLLLLLGEITPKTLAVRSPLALSARVVEPVLSVWVKVVTPLRYFVRIVSDGLISLFIGEARRDNNILAPDEFQMFLLDVEKEGVVSAAERRLITNLLDASSTSVTEIMVPRPQVIFIDADLPPSEIVEQFRRLRHRRVPVYRGRRDNLVGIIKEERVLELIRNKPQQDLTLDELIEPATLVPTFMRVGELAEFFKHGDHHAVILVNEFGGVEGLVSADDVFGYLTYGRGVFFDSYAKIKMFEDEENAYLCQGLSPLRDLRKATGFEIGRESEAYTVGGYVMAQLGRLPVPGEIVSTNGIDIKVISVNSLLVGDVLIAKAGHRAFKNHSLHEVPA